MYYFKRIYIFIYVLVIIMQGRQLLSQTIEYNQYFLVQNRATIFRNINIEGDSLIITGEIGADSLGLQGIFISKIDTFGNIGTVEIMKDPEQIDQMHLNGSNPVINNNDRFILTGEFAWISDNYFILYNKISGSYLYKEYSSPFLVRFTESLLELSGAYYVIGYIQTQDFDLDVFLQKIDITGNKIWEKTYGVPSKDETGRAAIIEDDGITIMVSESFDNTPTIKNDTRYWIRFMHVDTSGAIVRDWREEVTGFEGWSGTLLKYRDDYIYTCNTIGDEIGIGPLTGGQIVRRDSSFNLVWRKKLGDPDSPFTGLGDMIFSADNCLLVTGQNVDSSMTFNAARIIKIGLDGNVIWELRDTGYAFPDGQSLNFMDGIASPSCNSIYAVGYTYKSPGFYEGLLIKVTGDGCIDTLCTTTDIENLIRLRDEQVFLYPNPVRSELQIKLNDEVLLPAIVRLYDVYGRQIISALIDQNKTSMDLSGLANGLYYVVTEKNGLIIGSETIVKIE